ncbi:MAG TPA: rod shape-determining protein MreD [Acidimicrobiales bacterium]|nr:rod shape-determining protein MreD [Acidimicrobiales bacterium]
MSRSIAVKVGLIIVTCVVIQTSYVADFRVAGVIGNIVILIAVAAGVEGGAERGAIVGFAAGLTFDAVLQTPFGLWALVLSVIAYVVGTFQRSVLRAAWWIPVATAVAATLASVILYVLIGQLLGQQFRSANLPMILLVTSVMNGLLSPVMLRAMHWALPQERSPSGLLAR